MIIYVGFARKVTDYSCVRKKIRRENAKNIENLVQKYLAIADNSLSLPLSQYSFLQISVQVRTSHRWAGADSCFLACNKSFTVSSSMSNVLVLSLASTYLKSYSKTFSVLGWTTSVSVTNASNQRVGDHCGGLFRTKTRNNPSFSWRVQLKSLHLWRL